MSKHIDRSINWQPFHGADSLLKGEMVMDEEPLRKAFGESMFFYQFRTAKTVSRVMQCTDPSELEWLIKQVHVGRPVIVKKGPTCF